MRPKRGTRYLDFDMNPGTQWETAERRGEKGGETFYCSLISYVVSLNSWPFIRWIRAGKFVPVEPEKRNEIQYVLIWLMDGFATALWIVRLVHALCD